MVARVSPAEIARLTREGAAIIDLRDPREFEAGHPWCAICVSFDPRNLAERVSKVVDSGSALVLVANDELRARDAADQLEPGFRVVGFATAEPGTWQTAGSAWEYLETLSSSVFADPGGHGYHLLDVREPIEWETGFVPGAQLIPLGELRHRLGEVPLDRPVAVICEAGLRSATAASLLRAAGRPGVCNVADGTGGYRRAGYPLSFRGEDET